MNIIENDIFKEENCSVKIFTDYVANALQEGREQKLKIKCELAKDFVLRAIKPEKRKLYLDNWTNDFKSLREVLDAEDYYNVLLKLQKHSNLLGGYILFLRRMDILTLRFRSELKFGKSFYDILKDLHHNQKMTCRGISKYFSDLFHIYVSLRTINNWLRKMRLQKPHHIQMRERYRLGRMKQVRGVSRSLKPSVTKKSHNLKKAIYIVLNDEDYKFFDNFRNISHRNASEIINDIYKFSNLDPKISYFKINGLSRGKILSEGMRKFYNELLRTRMKNKKGHSFIVVPNSYHVNRRSLKNNS